MNISILFVWHIDHIHDDVTVHVGKLCLLTCRFVDCRSFCVLIECFGIQTLISLVTLEAQQPIVESFSCSGISTSLQSSLPLWLVKLPTSWRMCLMRSLLEVPLQCWRGYLGAVLFLRYVLCIWGSISQCWTENLHDFKIVAATCMVVVLFKIRSLLWFLVLWFMKNNERSNVMYFTSLLIKPQFVMVIVHLYRLFNDLNFSVNLCRTVSRFGTEKQSRP